MSNKLTLHFHSVGKLPKESRLYFVVFRVDDLAGKLLSYDWGFCFFNGNAWEELTNEAGTAKVEKWCPIPEAAIMVI